MSWPTWLSFKQRALPAAARHFDKLLQFPPLFMQQPRGRNDRNPHPPRVFLSGMTKRGLWLSGAVFILQIKAAAEASNPSSGGSLTLPAAIKALNVLICWWSLLRLSETFSFALMSTFSALLKKKECFLCLDLLRCGNLLCVICWCFNSKQNRRHFELWIQDCCLMGEMISARLWCSVSVLHVADGD